MDAEKNILDHLAVIVRWRRLIFFSFFTVTLCTAGVSLILPKSYRAYALIYPPQESQDALGISAILNNLSTNLLGIGEGKIVATDFEPVLTSETVRLAIADSFNLADRYETGTRQELLDEVGTRLQIELSREQFLSVSYEDETPRLAADITNAFVKRLDQTLRSRSREKARGYRQYLATRLNQARQDVYQSELSYSKFQTKYHAYDLETQAKAQIESADLLFVSLAELHIEREVAARTMTADNPHLKELVIKIDATRKAIDEMLMGGNLTGLKEGERNGTLPTPFIPFSQIPDLGLKAFGLMREIKIQNAILAFVQQEYEKTLFEENRDTPVVTVLDWAVPPDFRSSPRRTLMVVTAGGLSLMLSVLLAFIFEALKNLDETNRTKLQTIRDAFK
ncbi:MAG: Wzz/FepE/Etk N-terminal domain-containing protein [bacterium]|nr:Wzz/FepE/Etk N-terminal domain-containing protein [bacterium]